MKALNAAGAVCLWPSSVAGVRCCGAQGAVSGGGRPMSCHLIITYYNLNIFLIIFDYVFMTIEIYR